MRVRFVVGVVLALTVGACVRSSRCCDPCVPTGAEPRVVYAPAPAPTSVLGPVKPVAPPAPRPSIETLRLQTALLAKEVAALDPAARGARLGDALSREPRLVEGMSPGAWAALAPQALLVYDVSRLVEIAPDLPVAAIDSMTAHEEISDDPTDPRVARFANELRATLAAGAVYVHPSGAVLVASEPDRVAAVDAAVESVARVGTGVARLEIDVESVLPEDMAKRLGVGTPDGPWKKGASLEAAGPTGVSAPPDVYVRADAPSVPVTPMHLGVGVPSGSRFGSKHTTRTAYVQDFDLRAATGGGVADPIIGTIEAGTVVNVTHRPATATGPGALVVDLAWSELVEPVPTFQTTLENVSEAVTLDLPEVRFTRRAVAVPAVAGMAAFVRFHSVAFHVRVASIETNSPTTGPLVRRVAANESGTAARRAPAGADVAFRVGVSRAAAPAGAGSESVDAPLSVRVRTELGSAATVSMTNPVAYVRDFDVTPRAGSVIGDPVVATVEPGVSVSLRPHAGGDGRVVAAASIRVEDLDVPMRRVRLALGVGAPVTIDLPRTRVVVESTVASFEEGGANTWTLVGPAGRGDVVVVDLRREGPSAPATPSTPAPAALPVPAK